MDVRCEQCGTIYEFDDDRVTATGITVKCTTCDHIFKVFPKIADPAPPEPDASFPAVPPEPGGAGSKKEDDKRWLIRKPSGEIFKFKELTTLQQWIVEQKVSREDEISRTGKVWERLGAIKELDPFFTVVDKARAAEEAAKAATLMADGPSAPKPAPPAATPAPLVRSPAPPPMAVEPVESVAKPSPLAGRHAPAAAAPARADLLDQSASAAPARAAGPEIETSEPYTMGKPAAAGRAEPAFGGSRLELGKDTGARRAAWEDRPTPRRERDDPTDLVSLQSEEDEPRGSSLTKLILVVVLGVAAGFGGFAAWSKWDRIKALFSGSRNPAEGAYYKSRTLFRLDTESSYRQALEQVDRILAPEAKASGSARANALATRAEIQAAWAQYLRDDARDLERRAMVLERAGPGASPATGTGSAADLRRQAVEKEQAAKKKAQIALQAARQATGMEASLRTKRALAEASRVAGEQAEVVEVLVNDALTLGAKDPELHYSFAMLAYDKGELDLAQARLRKAIDLASQRTGKPFFRAQMRLARLYLERGREPEARTVLEAITERNPGHERAVALLGRLKTAPRAVALRPPPADAGAPPDMAPDARDVVPDPRRPGGPEDGADGDYDSLVRRAEKLSFAGQSARAMALYQKALAKRAAGVEALTGLGYAYLDQRRTGEAISHFRRALGVSGAYGEALIGIAEAYQRSGSAKQALRYYKAYLQHHPTGRRAVLAKQNVKELEEKVGGPAERPAPERPGMDPERPAPRVQEPPPAMDPERPAPMVREPPPAMDPERPAPMVREPPPAMEPPRPTPMVREPPPAPPRGM